MEISLKNPKVSIVMPAYNSRVHIVESIRSVIDQTYQNWELIIIDDGSSDDTFAIVDDISKTEPRIKLSKQKNQGIGATRNNGYKLSSGSWVAFLDHDDLWQARKLEQQIEVSISNPSLNVIFSGGWFFFNNNLEELTEYRTIYGAFNSKEMYLKQLEENYIATLSIMVKRSLIEEIGPWDERKIIQGCDDYDYWFRMAKAKAIFYGINEHLFYYRKHDNNYSNDGVKMFIAEANVLVKNFDRNILNTRSSIKKFEKKIHSIILSLIRMGEIVKTLEVLADLNIILPSIYGRASYNVLKKFREHSLLMVKLLFKAQRLIN
ncbi:teichuronic acid biosynthesis glycosyltransferase TuaG [Pedobacter sp. UYP24]